MRTSVVIVAAAVTAASALTVPLSSRVAAQSPASDEPTFEVASVKANKSGQPFIRINGTPNGRFEATNVPLRLLIRNAYQLQDHQIVGGPAWIASDRFDVIAKAPEGVAAAAPGSDRNPFQPMLRALLADRFHLVTHRETRELPIYVLLPARADGKLGPSLTVSTTDCAAEAGRGRRGGAPTPPQPGEPVRCGLMIGPGNMRGGGSRMPQFAQTLSQFVGRTVVDKTGLNELYDFTLSYTPEQMPPGPPGGGPPLVNGQAIDPNGPSIFTALQEQLGLKLDSQRGPVEVLVIDRVEQPTED